MKLLTTIALLSLALSAEGQQFACISKHSVSLMDGKVEELIASDFFIIDMQKKQYKVSNGTYKGKCEFHPLDESQILCTQQDLGITETLDLDTLFHDKIVFTTTYSAPPSIVASSGSCTNI